MRRLGARGHLARRELAEARSAACHFAGSNISDEARFAEDGREPEIPEGAGTKARELDRWPQTFDAAVDPFGQRRPALGDGGMVPGVPARNAVIPASS